MRHQSFGIQKSSNPNKKNNRALVATAGRMPPDFPTAPLLRTRTKTCLELYHTLNSFK